MPAVYLSGYIFPIENMPKAFQWFTLILPDRYYMNIIRGVVLRGATIKHLWVDALVLFIMSGLVLLMAKKRYRKDS